MYKQLRSINDNDCASFKEKCYEFGLIDDGGEYIEAIKEASFWETSNYLHFSFDTLLKSHHS